MTRGLAEIHLARARDVSRRTARIGGARSASVDAEEGPVIDEDDAPPRGSMSHAQYLGCLVGLVAAVMGCGGGSGGSEDGGADGRAGHRWSPVCPRSTPEAGAPCTPSPGSPSCEYGTNVNPGCNTVLTCAGSKWTVPSMAGGFPTCQQGNPPTCPAALSGIVAGSSCSPTSEVCSYPSGTCVCIVASGGGTWSCGPAAGCPTPRPRLGGACPSEGQDCAYLPCGATQECLSGVWQPVPVACP